jgi:tetratricopeptide (TPR) repeat protein
MARALCAIDPQNVSYLRQLGFAHKYLGSACLEYGELREAESAFVAFRDNRQAAVDADPADQDARRSLALAYQLLGDVAARRRDFDAARAGYDQALRRLEEIARRAPTSIMDHRERILAYRKRFLFETFAGRNDEAVAWIERELAVHNTKGIPTYPEHAAWVAEASFFRDIYRLIDRCIDNPALARAQPPKTAAALLELRAVALARSGRAALAAEAAAEVLTLRDAPFAPLYAARAYALAAASLDRSQSDIKSKYIRASVAALRKTIATTILQAQRFPFDPDFDVLHDDPEFIALTHP